MLHHRLNWHSTQLAHFRGRIWTVATFLVRLQLAAILLQVPVLLLLFVRLDLLEQLSMRLLRLLILQDLQLIVDAGLAWCGCHGC